MKKECRLKGSIRGTKNRREGEMELVISNALQKHTEESSKEMGKSFRAMGDKIEDLKEMLIRRLAEQDEVIRPIAQTFNNLRWGKKVVVGFLGFIATIGSVVALIIEIRKK